MESRVTGKDFLLEDNVSGSKDQNVGVVNPNSTIEAKDQLCDKFTEQ